MRWKKKDMLRFATWNIKSLNGRDQEVLQELKDHNIDICAVQETKKKGKGQKQYQDYILIYSGVEKEKRAKEGVGLLIHNKFKSNINNVSYISSRIIAVSINTGNQKLNVISIYAPEDNKPQQEREGFYDQLQDTIESITPNETTIILGDFNARIGNDIIPGIKQRFNEDVTNDNGELMINLCTINELRINNTFFNHKDQYKYTFENTRGQRSMIDYILSSRHLHPVQVQDIRTLNSANVGSDHKLLLGKIKLKLSLKQQKGPKKEEQKYNIESLWDQSTRTLYQHRLREKIERNPIKDEGDVNIEWDRLKSNIREAANEVIGTRTINRGCRKHNKTPWFTKEVKKKCKEKKEAHLKYRSLRTPESYEQYKAIRNETKSLVRQVQTSHWESFSKRMESDFYGLQKQMWRLIRTQRKEINELIEPKHISKESWVDYLKHLYKKEEEITDKNDTPDIVTDDNMQIESTDVELALKQLKNRKSPGPDGIPNELLKYGGQCLAQQLTGLAKIILFHHRIPDEWRTSISILMFKKGDRKLPENYRGINLLSSTLKLITKIITNKINSIISLSDEQQGFRTGRSCTDAVFVIRQIAEKSIEYNIPAYMCFIDLEKAFDRVQLQDVVHLLYSRQVPLNLIKVIENIYNGNKVQAKINGELTEPIPVEKGIRQGDSLSPLLFNLIMDEIIKQVRRLRGYRMGNRNITILCYADDAVLVAENEDDLQRLLYCFNRVAKTLNMVISTSKTKSLTTSKIPVRCKLVVDDQIIQQEMKFKYLGIELSGFGDVESEVRQQTNKALRVAGCLNDTIWKNKYLQTETKSRIYKATIRPIMTYTAETRPDTTKTKRILETGEMKVLRKIVGKTLLDRERNENIRRSCQVDNINEWVVNRKIEWNEHIHRMDQDRIVKIARDKSPIGRRSTGRPRKRWSDNLTVN